MHIPDGFLSAGVAGATTAAGALSLAAALARRRREPEPVAAATLGALSAFVFAAQMVNVPVAPGTSGHLVGATLVAALVGPRRGMLVISVVLVLQALLFQDGGITAYGANLLAMGAAGCFVGHGVALLVARAAGGLRGQVAGAVVGAFVATLAGAVLIAVFLSASGLYPLAGILPVLLVAHVAIGLLEAVLTGAILATVLRWRPDLAGGLQSGARPARAASALAGILGIALAIAAFLAPLASDLPDGLEATAERLGFAARARLLWPSPAPGSPLLWGDLGRVAPIAAGVAGTLLAAACAWALSRGLSGRRGEGHR